MNPIIYCDNPSDTLSNTVKKLNELLEQATNKQIIDNYEKIINPDMIDDNFSFLYEKIYDELNHITLYKYREWCELKTTQLITYIEGTILNLIKLNKIMFFTPDELAKFLHLNMMYQLDNNQLNGILNNIFFISDDVTESEDSCETDSSDESTESTDLSDSSDKLDIRSDSDSSE